jgi:glycosyltransferase involved in cell wall biosynthesis
MIEKTKIMGSEYPLVSIIVITYNSSKYVLETLESTKAQTYQNIELIISDDASTDGTVEICRKWVEQNKERFVRTEISNTPENTGITANYNRGVNVSQGIWIKGIAGDDMLTQTAIEDYVNFVNNQKLNVQFVAAVPLFFKGQFENTRVYSNNSFINPFLFNEKITANEQLKIIARSRIIPGNTFFFHRALFDDLGGFNEKYRMIEDLPFAIAACEAGHKIHFLNKGTVYYRMHEDAVSKASGSFLFNSFYKHQRPVLKDLTFPYLSFTEKMAENQVYWVKRTMDALHLNRKGFFGEKLFNVLAVRMNFFSLINKYKE